MKTAGRRQQRRHRRLVRAQQAGDYLPHRRKSFLTSPVSSSNVASRAGRRGFTTIIHSGPSRSRFSRTASRTLRLRRFRTTLFPIAFETVKPTLAWSCPGAARQKAAKQGPEKRIPLSYTSRNSEGRKSRRFFGKDESRFATSIGLFGVANGSFGAHRQLLAPLRPPARQDGLALLGLHSRPESVRFGTLPIIRLKCTLWHVRPLPRAGVLLSTLL